MIRAEVRAAFRRDGFVVVPGVLDDRQLEQGRAIARRILEREPPGPDHVGPYFLWPRFDAEPAGAVHPLLGFYRAIGLGALAAQLLRPEFAPAEPDFAQLASTIPPWPHRPAAPHVDGIAPLEPGQRPGTFTLLAGVWLSDQRAQHQGNLWVWPGTHVRTGRYLTRHPDGAMGLTRTQEMIAGSYPPVELGEPVQATGPAGSVLFAHYLLGHNIGCHDGPAERGARQTIYYRLSAPGHAERWQQAVTDPLLEFRAD